MKKQTGLSSIALLIVGMLLISCEKTILEDSNLREIDGTMEDIVAEEGVSIYQFNLDEIYSIRDAGNILPESQVHNNSNSALVNAEIMDYQLILHINIGQTGMAQITIRNRSAGVYKDDVFSIIISPIGAAQAMERAINHFSSGDYEQAQSHFKLVIFKNESALLSDAYMGLGFSRMRLGSEESHWGYQDLKTSRGLDPGNVDAIAGLGLLEYAINENYTEAILRGRETLNKDGNFVFRYDNRLDKSDILLNIALSQYASNLYEECLQNIQVLDPAYTVDMNAADFKTQLFQKLEQLIELHK